MELLGGGDANQCRVAVLCYAFRQDFAARRFLFPLSTMQIASKRRPAAGPPKTPIGIPRSGRVARLRLGHGDGFIRIGNARDIYFHRADLHDSTAFNTLRIGDIVIFELIEDAVSGARGVRVSRRAGA